MAAREDIIEASIESVKRRACIFRAKERDSSAEVLHSVVDSP